MNAAHVKALRGHKTDARDAARLAELLECGLLRGSCIPSPELRDARDLVRYRTKTVQARTAEELRLAKTLESAGIKLGSVVSEIAGKGPVDMIRGLIDGERRGAVLAQLARGPARTRQKIADLSMALEGRFNDHHALMCRLQLDRIAMFNSEVAGLDERIAAATAPWDRETGLLKSIHRFGDITARAFIAGIGPRPQEWFDSPAKLASWCGLAPGNHVSAGKRGYGRTGQGGRYIKPLLVQCARAAAGRKGRLQARCTRLVRRMGGPKNPAARKKAIVAVARTLLKTACAVLRDGAPCTEPGEDFYTRRQDPAEQHGYLVRRLRRLHEGMTVTVTVTPGASADTQLPTGTGPQSPPGEHRTPA